MSAPKLSENWRGELEALEPGWYYNSAPISIAALEKLGSFQVVPCTDGGIQLEAHKDGWDIEICIAKTGRIRSAIVEFDVSHIPVEETK